MEGALLDGSGEKFRLEILLPGIAGQPEGLFRRMLAVSAIAIGNSAQFERDMKAIRELWRKRSTEIDGDNLTRQARGPLNFAERSKRAACPQR